MSEIIRLRKGLDIKLQGVPSEEIVQLDSSETYALCPDSFTGIVPKVVVKENDNVLAGQALFVDKNVPQIKFVSPVSGQVLAINRGARRKVLSVVVKSDGKNESVKFPAKSVQSLSAKEILDSILEAGLFAFFRQRPYDVIANPNDTPREIFVSAFDSKPLAPCFEKVLEGRELEFQIGLSALSKIAHTNLGVCCCQKSPALTEAKNVDVYKFSGAHPAGNVGVQINHIKPVNKGDIVWTIAPQDVIMIGCLFNKGAVDFSRIITVAGSRISKPSYAKVIMGARLGSIVTGSLALTQTEHTRVINGNVLTGAKAGLDDYLDVFANCVTAIPEGDDNNEFMGWIMPRFKMFSTSRASMGWLKGLFCKNGFDIDARVKGSERHMIMSGEYDKVFPMDIYPEYLVKAMITGNIDKMEAYGIYEVAPEDFALCEFVDSSKLELQRIVRESLDKLRAEMA